MKKEVISTPLGPSAIGPYSQAIRAGDLLFVSGQIPIDPSTGKILGKIETTNADFIDIGANGDMVAGAVRTSLMLYRPTL